MRSQGRHRRLRGLGRRFNTLWAGQAASQFGDYVAFLTIPLFVKELTDRAFDFGLVYAAETVPALLFGIFGGVLLDRVPLRPLLVFTDLARAFVFVALALVASSSEPAVWMVVTLSFLVGMFAAGFVSGLRAFLPSILPQHQLASGNTRLALSEQMVFVVGPAVGALTVVALGFSASYLLNAATFVVSALTLASLRGVRPRRPIAKGSYLTQVGEGFGYLFSDVRLRLVTVAGAVVNFTVAFFEAMLVLLGIRLFGLESPEEFGAFYVLFGVGAVIGAAMAARLVNRLGLIPALVLGMTVYGIGFLLLTVVTARVPSYAVLVMIGLGPPVINVAVTTVRQIYTPEHLLGRVTAASRAIVWGTLPLGALVGGMLADRYPIETVARLLPVLILATALWLRISAIWKAPREAVAT